MAKRKQPVGSSWRILAQSDSGGNVAEKIDIRTEHGPVFDELVIDHWLHLEQMDSDRWWMRVGAHTFWFHVLKNGSVAIETDHDPLPDKMTHREDSHADPA